MDALYIIRFLFPCPSEWVQPGTYSSGHVLKLAGSGKVSPVCVRAAACLRPWGGALSSCRYVYGIPKAHIYTKLSYQSLLGNGVS